MLIGITTDLRYSLFSAGHGNTCFAVAKIFQAMNCKVFFIHKQDADWWDDTHDLKEGAPTRIHIDDVMSPKQPKFDLIIELTFLLKPSERRIAKRCVWYNRKPTLFSDIESCVYANKPEGRQLEGIASIWLSDIYTTPDDIVYLETLYPGVPIETVPWIWTPDIVEMHRKQTQSPAWPQIYNMIPKDSPWSLHVCETNMSSTSSSTLPMVMVRHAQLTKKMPLSRIIFHNMDILKENKFFKENILKHSEVPDISFTMMGRQRIIDWVHDQHSIILSHSRFVDLKMANLEAAWVGIPIIHNSAVLKSLGNGLESLYYPNNSVSGASKALQVAMYNCDSIPYCSTLEGLSELRKVIIQRFYPLARADEWTKAIMKVMNMATPMVRSMPTPMVAPMATPLATPTPDSSLNILFTDMWDQFNESHNMFLLALETGLKDVKVIGHTLETIGDKKPDLVIFGPFGDAWTKIPGPKVHFTGENTPLIKDPSVKLNIGYKLPEMSDNTYIRMPLWMFEIDWFGADLEQIRNPLPLPIDACTKVNPDYDARAKFCAFVVSNPTNEVRNKAFMALNSYKTVDSAGRLFNNVGDVIFAGLGGGGGELKKHEFLKDYRFNIAYENQAAPGYTTEKILHAKAAGCIPIYWGDSKVGRDFNEKGFINANACKSEADLIKLVDEVESNPERWKEMAAVPALSTYSRDLVRRTFAELVRRMLVICGKDSLAASVPPFIGAKTSEEADKLRAKRPTSKPSAPPIVQIQDVPIANPDKLLLVTMATQRFWPFLIMWLNSVKAHSKAIKNARVRVYVGADVSDSSLKMTSEKYQGVEFIRLPTETPNGFADFWDPKHYAWKIWIYNEIANDSKLKNTLIMYTDAGSATLRWPSEWVQHAIQNGISVLEDSTQKNKHWCHQTFCEILKVTQEEKESQQIVAGLMVFIAGHPAPCKLFTDAYKLAQDQDVIVGDKWSGVGPDSHPFGHRHDQSILSILTHRMKLPRFPLEKVYGDKSARTTFHSGQCIYVHRGNFKTHVPLVEGIDECFIINLDRRTDRKEAFLAAHPDLKGYARRIVAYDGRSLTLTPSLTRLFKTNDFFWKKAVMGCALSHLKTWNMLISEPPEIKSFLIMEDDARLDPGWRDAWNTAYKSLPADWDCVYLGGVLPPNRQGFVNTLERVGPSLAKVLPNKFFGQNEPTSYFHFCAYAYVLSRQGAQKILQSILDRDGYWTSADHMICNRVDKMNLYVLDPLVAGASQDNDPSYQSAQFNDFSRVDNFDSDLWNNDERFSVEEIQAQMAKGAPLQIGLTIAEVDQMIAVAAPVPSVAAVPSVVPIPSVAAIPSVVAVPSVVPKKKGLSFVSLDVCNLDASSLYESGWLQDLFQTKFTIDKVSITDSLDNYDDLVVVVIKTLWAEQIKWLNRIASERSFKILHLSDEYGTDPIDFYSWPQVTGVMRIYPRPDISDPKILVVPLGYHWQFRGNRDVPHLSTPELPFRDNMWSFAGTDWLNRSKDMAILQNIRPHYIKWFEDWNDPAQLKEEEYLSLLLSSKFIPCPRGQNVETYRFYEALDCGCIPLFINTPDNEAWLNLFEGKMPFLKLDSWMHAAALMQHFETNKEQMENYRRSILISWANYKMGLKEKVRVWLNNKV